jgi:hypothetical protein
MAGLSIMLVYANKAITAPKRAINRLPNKYFIFIAVTVLKLTSTFVRFSIIMPF